MELEILNARIFVRVIGVTCLLAGMSGCSQTTKPPAPGARASENTSGAPAGLSPSQTPLEEPMSLDEAMRTLKSLGGVVEMNVREGDLRVTAITLSDPRVQDDDLRMLKALPGLEIVRLTGTSVTDTCLPRLKALPQLRIAVVSGTKVSEEGMEDLQRHLAGVHTDIDLGVPTPQDCLSRQVAWAHADKSERSTENWIVYKATVDGQNWTVRMNDFPAEPLYTLQIEGKEIIDFNNWPERWTKPSDPNDDL